MASALPPALERLVRNMSMLQGIGEKTAVRLAMQILKWPEAKAGELAASIGELHSRIKRCSSCSTFSETDPCPICSAPSRDSSQLCIVEQPADMLAIEKSGAFKGRYHVLHGAIAPLDGIGPAELGIERMVNRIRQEGVEEVIVATSSTAAGEATASCIIDALNGSGTKISRIACGIPMGMDIKYADDITLQRAMGSRVMCHGQ